MKRLATTLSIGIGGLATFGFVRRRRAVAAALPELRNRQLYLPMSLRNDLTLRIARRLFARGPAPAPVVPARTVALPATAERAELRVLLFERPDRTRPSGALLWIHGGGLVMGTPEVGTALCGRIADELGVLVVGVDYRLAPEHPFPAGLDDCYAALTWLHDQTTSLGIDPARIAVGGDSAGGGLAAVLAQLVHDRGGPPICFQLLEYPMLDDRTSLRNDAAARSALVWSNISNRYAWTAYLGRTPTLTEVRPYVAAARRLDLGGLPPAWVGVGDIDLFHDEDVAYAQRLRDAGVPCELHVEPGMYHGADQIAVDAPSMHAFHDRMVEALRHAIG